MSETANAGGSTAEDTTTTTASGGDQGGSGESTSGSSTTGSGSGSQSTEGALSADQVAELERRARDEQSRADRLEFELKQLRDSTTATPPAETKPASTEDLLALLDRRDAIASVKATATEKFPNADPSILARANQFETAEALTVALQSSHDTLTQHIEARTKTEADGLVAKYRERYGDLEPTPPDAGGSSGGGDPTIEQLAAMTSSEFDAVPQEVVDRVMRSAQGGSN